MELGTCRTSVDRRGQLRPFPSDALLEDDARRRFKDSARGEDDGGGWTTTRASERPPAGWALPVSRPLMGVSNYAIKPSVM